MTFTVRKANSLIGKPVIPGDKSLSHRALIFGAMAEGATEITHLLHSADVHSTAQCLAAIGVRIETHGRKTTVHGVGPGGFTPPRGPLPCGNSGTTMRLLMGCLSSQEVTAELVGDSSLSQRPMDRVAEPLRLMGASIKMHRDSFPPVTVRGSSRLKAITFEMKVASAQVKSALLLAALNAEGTTRITGKIQSRDHTERLLTHFGAHIDVRADSLGLRGSQRLRAAEVEIPGDPSSAAFWLAAACIVPESTIEMDNILLNPTRTGLLRVLQKMGAPIEPSVTSDSPEPRGKLKIGHSRLNGITLEASEVPFLIDELPLLAVLGAYADGITEVHGAEELRIKETDRIEAMASNLRKMGATLDTLPDGFRIRGPQKLHGAVLDSCHDHRIAMALSVAALGADGDTHIEHAEAVDISYPTFFDTLKELTGG